MTDRNAFGPRLKREREQRGVALTTIAAATKIKESLFVELERNDFSNWPDGIFRRAHLCAYAAAIGLPPQTILAEYLRLFPENQPDAVPPSEAAGVHRPGQAPKPVASASRLMDRTWVVSFDAAAVCLLSTMVAAVTRTTFLPAMALAGFAYSALGSACFAQSIGQRLHQRIRAALESRRGPQAVVTTPRLQLQPIVFKQPRPSVAQSAENVKAEVEERRASA